MDIMFIQETIDSLRTLTRQNGALTQQNSQLINDIVKESTLNSAKEEILIAVENAKPEVDLSGVAQEGTLQEVKNAVENIDFTPIEEKIDNIDLSSIKGDNPEATNSKIFEKLSVFESLIPKETVYVVLNCEEAINWSEYYVEVIVGGISKLISITENGTCSLEVSFGSTYSVVLPNISSYPTPKTKEYISESLNREIYYSYVPYGVFGLDELGRRYTIEQIESLSNKSIIKYGGLTNEKLDEGDNGFIWELGNEFAPEDMMFATQNVAFSEDLLPLLDKNTWYELCDGKTYTKYILSEAERLDIEAPAASYCVNKITTINKNIRVGFMPSSGQGLSLLNNSTLINSLYSSIGIECPFGKDKSTFWVAAQAANVAYGAIAKYDYQGVGIGQTYKNYTRKVFVIYPL